ncbi:MAG TPA: tRNA dihydrouridine synthase DusB [Rhodothermales bacterium]|nr:tRNA dihydrouridine synthase DusB [Rhodothermales bacterium]
MRIGPIELADRPIVLAPMEDVSDPPFRILCKRFGADLLYTEFISSSGLLYDVDDSVRKLDFDEAERPVGIQIFGGEVDQVREAARIVDAAGPDLIDINFGCPVKKVVCKGGGAGILKDMPRMRAITDAVVSIANRPVTVKTRLGWDDRSIRILEVARMLEDAGVAALAVHARTRAQMYRGEAQWSWLRRIKEESGIAIPFIGNGDATTPEKIATMFDQTGVDAVMVGRGAIGNPWIFRDAKFFMATGEIPPPPSWEERVSVVREHLELKCAWLGERKGVLEMRRMYGGYFKGFRCASRLRQMLMNLERMEDVAALLGSFDPNEAGDIHVVPEGIARTTVRKAQLPSRLAQAAG